jgi:hypothetical protein
MTMNRGCPLHAYSDYLLQVLLICGGGVEGNAYTVYEWEWKVVRADLPFNVNPVTTMRLKSLELSHKIEREARRTPHRCFLTSQL